jgi:hypothetical protein
MPKPLEVWFPEGRCKDCRRRPRRCQTDMLIGVKTTVFSRHRREAVIDEFESAKESFAGRLVGLIRTNTAHGHKPKDFLVYI